MLITNGRLHAVKKKQKVAIIEKHIAVELFLQNDKTQKKRSINLVDVEKELEDLKFDPLGESESDEDEILDYVDDYVDESDDED